MKKCVNNPTTSQWVSWVNCLGCGSWFCWCELARWMFWQISFWFWSFWKMTILQLIFTSCDISINQSYFLLSWFSLAAVFIILFPEFSWEDTCNQNKNLICISCPWPWPWVSLCAGSMVAVGITDNVRDFDRGYTMPWNEKRDFSIRSLGMKSLWILCPDGFVLLMLLTRWKCPVFFK